MQHLRILKLLARLDCMVREYEASIHSATTFINMPLYGNIIQELTYLYQEVVEAENRLRCANDLLYKKYTEGFLQWRKDIRRCRPCTPDGTEFKNVL